MTRPWGQMPITLFDNEPADPADPEARAPAPRRRVRGRSRRGLARPSTGISASHQAASPSPPGRKGRSARPAKARPGVTEVRP
jgi:hypothetical protein